MGPPVQHNNKSAVRCDINIKNVNPMPASIHRCEIQTQITVFELFELFILSMGVCVFLFVHVFVRAIMFVFVCKCSSVCVRVLPCMCVHLLSCMCVCVSCDPCRACRSE